MILPQSDLGNGANPVQRSYPHKYEHLNSGEDGRPIGMRSERAHTSDSQQQHHYNRTKTPVIPLDLRPRTQNPSQAAKSRSNQSSSSNLHINDPRRRIPSASKLQDPSSGTSPSATSSAQNLRAKPPASASSSHDKNFPGVVMRQRYTSSDRVNIGDSTHSTPEDDGSSGKPEVGQVFYTYAAREPDELSFQRGSVVEILNKDCGEQGWIYAKIDDREGMIPENYVRLIGRKPKEIQKSDLDFTLEEVGNGSFSRVFRGYYKKHEVALKEPKTNNLSADHKEIVEAIRQEALIYARLNHKNIVSFHGICYELPCLVLEICKGGTLFNLNRKLAYSVPSTVVYWSIQIASGMKHLHDRDVGLLHADLKADNVLIKEQPCLCDHDEKYPRQLNPRNFRNGTCIKCKRVELDRLTLKLTDFGLSRAETSTRDSLSGSVPWMSPELIQTSHHSKSSDVYAFGIVVWELITRQMPLREFDKAVLWAAIALEYQTPVVPDDCPEALADLMHRCWKREPDRRPSFSELITQLRKIKGAQSVADSTKKLDYKDSIKKIQPDENELRRLVQELNVKLNTNSIERYTPNMHVLQPRAPLPVARRGKNVRTKIGKDTIGPPMDFQHLIKVQTSSDQPRAFNQTPGGSKRRYIIEYSSRGRNRSESNISSGTMPTRLRDVNTRNQKGNSIFFTDHVDDSTVSLNSQESQSTCASKKPPGIRSKLRAFFSKSGVLEDCDDQAAVDDLKCDRPPLPACHNPGHANDSNKSHLCALSEVDIPEEEPLRRYPEIEDNSHAPSHHHSNNSSQRQFLKNTEDPQWKRRAVAVNPLNSAIPLGAHANGGSRSTVSSQVMAQLHHRHHTNSGSFSETSQENTPHSSDETLAATSNCCQGAESTVVAGYEPILAAQSFGDLRPVGLLSDDNADLIIHQRSRSTDDPMHRPVEVPTIELTPIHNRAYVPMKDSIYGANGTGAQKCVVTTSHPPVGESNEDPNDYGVVVEVVSESKFTPTPPVPPRLRPDTLGHSVLPAAPISWRSAHSPSSSNTDSKHGTSSPHRRTKILDKEVVGSCTGVTSIISSTPSASTHNGHTTKRTPDQHSRRFDLNTPVYGQTSSPPFSNNTNNGSPVSADPCSSLEDHYLMPILNPAYKSQVEHAAHIIDLGPPLERAPPPPTPTYTPKHMPRTSAQIRKVPASRQSNF